MAIKHVLVTGSDGYIGSVLVQELLEKDYLVTGVDTLYYYASHIEKIPTYTLKRKDIRDITREDLEGIDALIHLAALSNDALGELQEKLTHDINFKATVRLAKLCKKAGVKRFLFSSSCSIYGIASQEIVSEESETNPLTAYASSKILSEEALQKLADDNFCVGILRNSTVYGYSPSFRSDLVVNNFVSCALTLEKILVESDGTPWRPLIDVHDLSQIFIKFLEVNTKKINGAIINVGFSENNFQVKDLLGYVKKVLPKTVVTYTGMQPDSRSYKVSFKKFEKIFPEITQQWHMDKSVYNLKKQLQKYNLTATDFLAKKHARLSVLKILIEKKRLTKRLYWFENKK